MSHCHLLLFLGGIGRVRMLIAMIMAAIVAASRIATKSSLLLIDVHLCLCLNPDPSPALQWAFRGVHHATWPVDRDR